LFSATLRFSVSAVDSASDFFAMNGIVRWKFTSVNLWNELLQFAFFFPRTSQIATRNISFAKNFLNFHQLRGKFRWHAPS